MTITFFSCHVYKCILCFVLSWYSKATVGLKTIRMENKNLRISTHLFGSDKSPESHFMIHETVSERPSHYADWILTFMYMHTHKQSLLILCKCTFTGLLLHSYHQSAFSSLWQIKTSARQQLSEKQSCVFWIEQCF